MSPDTPTSPKFFEAPSRAPTTKMIHDSPEERSLDQLQAPEQLTLLDTIDELRKKGLGNLGISLPQLIVCGDQSSGKSSLLEGLTRLRFPIDNEQCTTFATEVVLRRGPHIEIVCTITPGKDRSPENCRELNKFNRSFSSPDQFHLPSVIDEARSLMRKGREKSQGTVFEDVLRVRYCGPDLPSLTIVDLPGMIDHKREAGDEPERILELVTSYMRNEKSIILAVVHTGSDLENQKVLKQVDRYDPHYSRTLGIITKPDKLDRGSPEEKKLIKLAENEKCPFLHGWHAVRNRASLAKAESDAARDETERQFFATGAWAFVPRADVGIASLRTKLSRMLLEHVTTEVPSIVVAVQDAITSTKADLKILGDARETSYAQRNYLTAHAQEFHVLTHDALSGMYSNPFFALSSPDEEASTRLRTAIQNLNIAFAHAMYRKGHTWYISDGRQSECPPTSLTAASTSNSQRYDIDFEEPVTVDRANFLENHIGFHVRHSRQSGLPSLVNPLVIGDVFRQQSKHWHKIAKYHLRQVHQATTSYVEKALGSLMDKKTCALLMLKHIQPELDLRWDKVEEKLDELIMPYTEHDPITYDPAFLKNLEDIRAARHPIEDPFDTPAAHKPFDFGRSSTSKTSSTSHQRLLTESLDDFTNSEILDLVTTYYKSAISVFISNVAVLAVENCLIKNLSGIFSPVLTANMTAEQLHAIAAESKEIRSERSDLRERLAVLENGKQALYEHIATAPRSLTKRMPSSPSRKAVETRPRTPLAQTGTKTTERSERRGPDNMVDLTSKLDNLVVTPPASGSNTRESSRRRVDSATTSPPKDGAQRQRIRIQNVIKREPSDYESDSEY